MATPAIHPRHPHAAYQPGRRVWLGLTGVILAGGLAVLIDRTAFPGGSQKSQPDLQRVIDGLSRGRGGSRPA